MTFTLTWRQIGLYGGFISLGFLAGFAAAYALMQRTLPDEIAAQLVVLVLFVIASVIWIGRIVVNKVGEIIEALQPQIAENTRITKVAAVNAESAANHADERATLVRRVADMTQELTVKSLRMEAAERVVHLIEATPDCTPCKAAIARSLDGWRMVYAQTVVDADRASVQRLMTSEEPTK